MQREQDDLTAWFSALETRHLKTVSFQEARRGLQALSGHYVHRRKDLSQTVFDGAGKRAAYAMFYGPLHFLLVRSIVRALDLARPPLQTILDLGCGTGAPSAAWALEARDSPSIVGFERNPWACREARATLRDFGIQARIHTADLKKARMPEAGGGVLAALVVNELDDPSRARLLEQLLRAGRVGARILIVEPIARKPIPWWSQWSDAFAEIGGDADLWKIPVELPAPLQALDRAAGLDHRVLKGRSIAVGFSRNSDSRHEQRDAH